MALWPDTWRNYWSFPALMKFLVVAHLQQKNWLFLIATWITYKFWNIWKKDSGLIPQVHIYIYIHLCIHEPDMSCNALLRCFLHTLLAVCFSCSWKLWTESQASRFGTNSQHMTELQHPRCSITAKLPNHNPIYYFILYIIYCIILNYNPFHSYNTLICSPPLCSQCPS